MIASHNSMDLEQFKESLEASGETYKNLRESVRNEMIIQRVQRGRVAANVEISEQEIENYLNSEEGKSRLAEQYNVQQILLSIKSGASTEEIILVEKKGLKTLARFSSEMPSP